MHNHNWPTENFHYHIGIEKRNVLCKKKKVTLPK